MVQAVQARGFAEPTTLVELPDPEPGPGEVLVDVLACAVGLTTRNMLRGDLGDDPRLLPLVPGHELVGTVSGVGPGVTSRWLGQRVTAHFYLFCGLCLRCLAGEEPLCEALEGMLGVHRPGPWLRRSASRPGTSWPCPSTSIPSAPLSSPMPSSLPCTSGSGRESAPGTG